MSYICKQIKTDHPIFFNCIEVTVRSGFRLRKRECTRTAKLDLIPGYVKMEPARLNAKP